MRSTGPWYDLMCLAQEPINCNAQHCHRVQFVIFGVRYGGRYTAEAIVFNVTLSYDYSGDKHFAKLSLETPRVEQLCLWDQMATTRRGEDAKNVDIPRD